jgi:PAS domain S-box-containing protein
MKMKRKGNKSETASLRHKAEELLKKKLPQTSFLVSETEILKLNHELEVHQIELEIQNEELARAKEQADVVAQKYSDLYNYAPSGYFTLSREGEIIELNPYGANILGKEIRQLRRSMFGFFVSAETRPVFNSFLRRVFKTKVEESCDVSLSADDNQPIYVYLNGIANKNGEHCFVIVVDITDHKRAAELIIANKELAFQNEVNEIRAAELIINNKKLMQLVQLNEDKDLFISILAHDLINPFNSLLGLSQLLTENIRQYDLIEIETISNQIFKTSQNTYKLLEDILMWARTHSGKIPFKPQKLDLKEICKNILSILKHVADTKSITMECFAEDDITVFADIDMLKAVLRNLVSNAIKFTNTGGQINIYVEKNNTDITIAVSDNGIGIESENLTKLFDISQIQTTTGTAEETGTGLGLEKHGGKIRVESEYGIGSVFKFSLPVFP